MKEQSIFDQRDPVKQIQTGTKHRKNKKVSSDPQTSRQVRRYHDGKSAAIYQQQQQDEIERRKKLNPRLVFLDPEVFFTDSQQDQTETP